MWRRALRGKAWTASAVVALTVALLAGCSGGDTRAGEAEHAAGTSPHRPTTTPSTTEPPPPSTAPSTTTTPTTTAPTTTGAPPSPAAHEVAARPVTASPTVASDPAALAAQLLDAERTIRDGSATPAVVSEAAHVQQVAYRVIADHPEWDRTVAATIPADLRAAVVRNVAARRELRGMHTRLLDHLPGWRIVAPRPPDELLGHYREAERVHGVPWQYLAAIHLVETAIGRVDGVSTAGAQGPMQFMPATWASFGEGDVRNPRDAILAAGRYLAHNGAPHDMSSALFNYNRSHRYVRAVANYAAVMAEDPAAYRGYYHWQVYVLTVLGDVVLPVGYDEPERVPVLEYAARGG